MVWVLHAAGAWIPLHLALRGPAAMGWVTPSVATHALTVGAIGALMVACYLLVLGAALVRVFVPLIAPAQMVPAVLLSAALWSAGFAVYALHYGRMMIRPRIDGRPG